MIGAVALLALLLVAVRFGPPLFRHLRLRARQGMRQDPSADPFAHELSEADRARVRERVAELRGTQAGAGARELAEVLALCEASAWCWYWRGGVRLLEPWLGAHEGSGHDRLAIEAEIRAALGELDAASSLLAHLPADHWRACVVRAVLYDARGDDARAESALVAARELGPSVMAERLEARLADLRGRAADHSGG